LPHEVRVAMLEKDHPGLSLSRQAELLSLSRSSIYYQPYVSEADIRATHCIDQIFTDYPFYGSRRIKEVLSREYDIDFCREHVQRLMRLMGLVAPYPKRNTSKPDHLHRVYPYLLKQLTIEYPDHVWGTDITYIKLTHGFCYLVAIIDWYSRKVVHWELSPTLEIGFCLTNITEALKVATPTIHNSDQGSHFTSDQYVDILKEANVAISMDGRGRCMDNIFTERLWRSVKYELIYLHEFTSIDEVRGALTRYFIFYNSKRPHQSLDYKTPDEVYYAKQTKLLDNKDAPVSLSTISTFTV
jgi:putative transposase